MIITNIPGSDRLEIEHFVSDFSGTLSENGFLVPGVKEKLNELAEKISVHVLTSDTFGKARTELEGITCTVHILEGEDHTGQKEKYVLDLGADKVAAIGNGNNLSLPASELPFALKKGVQQSHFRRLKYLYTPPQMQLNCCFTPKDS